MTTIQGGKVIASGGFGCLFKQALKCENSITRDKSKVTKLMTKKHALSEYNEINNLKNILNKIPNYTIYFLLDNFTICKPDKLTPEDLVNFKNICSALPKDNIDEKNINKSLDKVLALNMPYGGITVDDYVKQISSIFNFYYVNKSLINLFKNGILEMNKLNIYHTDIKDSNILVEKNNILYTRLIDWGLSTHYVPCKNSKFPSSWYNRPLQFNVPFSVIIFTELFVEDYAAFIENGNTLTQKDLQPFVYEYLKSWIEYRGPGHYEFINTIMFMLFSNDIKFKDDTSNYIKEQYIGKKITTPYIVNYIVAILIKFNFVTKNNVIYLREYLDEVFIHILDLWGFLMTYVPMLEVLFNSYNKLTPNRLEIFNHLKKMFIVYLFSPRTEKINTDIFISDLEKFGVLLKNDYAINISKNKKIGGSNKTIHSFTFTKTHKKNNTIKKRYIIRKKNKKIKNKTNKIKLNKH